MRNYIVLIFTLFVNLISAQEENKFRFHSLDIGFGSFSINKENTEGGGATFLGCLTTAYHKNLIEFSVIYGAEIDIIGAPDYEFNNLSVLYGREIKLNNWFSFETFAGFGYFSQTNQNAFLFNESKNESSLSYPLKLNTKFYLNKKFALGVNAMYIINPINNVFTVNLIFTFKFNQ